MPLQTLADRGIALRTADGANAFGVAELTIGLTLAALRHIPFTHAGVRAGEWPRRLGREIRGRNFGVVGMGAVGREVARLATAFGAKVLAYDPLRPPAGAAEPGVHMGGSGDRVGRVRDREPALSGARGRSADDRRLELATFRRGAVLVNTARAALVDEASLLMALQSGQVDVYATDVYTQEPPRDLALFKHDRVIAVSHIGGYTRESVERATTAAVANLLEALARAS